MKNLEDLQLDPWPWNIHFEIQHKEVSEESYKAIQSILSGETVEEWESRKENHE